MEGSNSIQLLVELGFTRLEAEVYGFLLHESPATGYRVAQAIGKPAANTYKAIETLESKGMIIVEKGEKRLCRAIPLRELLARLERGFRKRVARAEDLLSSIESDSSDDGIYHIRTPDQVIERSRSMLEKSQRIVVMDAFPQIIERLEPEIRALPGRGVDVTVIVYQPIDLPGARVVLDPRGLGVRERWPTHIMLLVIDGAELLQAYMSIDDRRVYEAIWSQNVFLAWLYHVSILEESTLTRLEKVVRENGPHDEMRKILDDFRRPEAMSPLGYQVIRRRIAQ